MKKLILASDVVSGLNKSVVQVNLLLKMAIYYSNFFTIVFFIQLKIDLVDAKGNISEEVLEMTHEELTSLLRDLKAAQKVYLTED